MRKDTIKRKKATKGFRQLSGDDHLRDKMFCVMAEGKRAFDGFVMELGKMLMEAILYIEREELSGLDYRPIKPGLEKWASQGGSAYIGAQKVKLQVPRLRDRNGGEVRLQSYLKMKEAGQFSEEMLQKILFGFSAQKYEETLTESAERFGVSPTSVSRHIVMATAKKIQTFKDRNLADFKPFAMFLDTIHRGDEAFIVALGVNTAGEKMALGFWQGATENHEICNALLADLERRGLKLVNRIIWVTDGGSGIIKSLRDRFDKKLLHQRCTIHKDRNIQRHLQKEHRKEAHKRFTIALEQTSYNDAKKMLLELECWLRKLNESAADSLLEAIEEILTLHRLKIPHLLRKSLHSTNCIESMFSTVRKTERNIKRHRSSRMMHRWLATTLLHCEKGFKKIKGYLVINEVIASLQEENNIENGATVQILDWSRKS